MNYKVKFYLQGLEDCICPSGMFGYLVWVNSSTRDSETARNCPFHRAQTTSPSSPCTHQRLDSLLTLSIPCSCLLGRVIDIFSFPQTHFMGHKVYFCFQMCDRNTFIAWTAQENKLAVKKCPIMPLIPCAVPKQDLKGITSQKTAI